MQYLKEWWQETTRTESYRFVLGGMSLDEHILEEADIIIVAQAIYAAKEERKHV